MATRRKEYLFIYVSKTIEIPESELGSGKTLTGTFSSTSRGAPSAIGSLSESATALSEQYTLEFLRADFVSQLGADYIGKSVFLHLDDGAAWHDTYEYVVTDVDPDLLPPLL